MDWFRYIDIYCERTAPGFWDEPLNAVSNGAFLIAAIAAGVEAGRNPDARGDRPLIVLIGLVAAIGTGSFLFHTYAQYWSLLADVIPISVFIYSYLGFALRRYLGFAWPLTLGLLFVFIAASLALDHYVPSQVLYGSVTYFPAILALYGVSAVLKAASHPAARPMLVAAVLLTVSIFFRTIDLPLCGSWPTGTHYVWHTLNGCLLFWLLHIAIKHGRRGAGLEPAQA